MSANLTESLADQLLVIIRKRPEHSFKLKLLADRLKIDTDQLGWEITQLHQWGYRVKKTADSISFLSAPDILSPVEIGHRLKTESFGQVIHAFKSVKSTNDLAREMAEAGALEGTLVIAEEQTKGRGRFQRSWYSPTGLGIYMSLILRPNFAPEKAPALSIVAAFSLATTIGSWLPGRVMIKWPNDILLGRKNSRRVRKTAGILTELSADKDKINYVIVGVGINVNQTAPEFPDELKKQATSIRRALRRKLSRVELLQVFLLNLEKNYQVYVKHGLKPMSSRLCKLSYLISREVRVQTGRNIIEGTAIDIDQNGRLIVETATGAVSINAGEVTVLKE